MDAPPPPEQPTRRRSGVTTVLLGAAIALAVVVGAVAATVATRSGGLPRGTATYGGVSRLDERLAATDEMPLPEVTLDGFAEGPPIDLAAYGGEPLVVNFWASWCAPCVEEMPDFQRVAADTQGDVAFLGVNVQDAPGNAQAFVDELDITYDLASDPRGAFYAQVQGFGMPTTLFVRPDGTIVFRHTGALTDQELRDLLATHLSVQA
jgi:cytochrome c biogenesis protein CcmG/thiol:disulfide interchange protein DsbE